LTSFHPASVNYAACLNKRPFSEMPRVTKIH
jgi:hypothetical protein